MTKEQRMEYQAAKMRLRAYSDPRSGGYRRRERFDPVTDRDIVVRYEQMLRDEFYMTMQVRDRHQARLIRQKQAVA